jgi:hypothetical protein
MNKMWSLLNTLKLIETLNLLKVQVPDNVYVFFSILKQFLDLKKAFVAKVVNYLRTWIIESTESFEAVLIN